MRLMVCTTVPETLATILLQQCAHLSQHMDLTLVTSQDDRFLPVVEGAGLRVLTVPMRRRIAPLADVRSVLSMVRLLRAERPEVLHSYTPKAGLVAMLAGWICRVPVRVHTFTGLVFPTATGLKKALLAAADRLICACATHVVPEGAGVKRELEAHGITRKPLKVIGHGNIAGVDTQRFNPAAPGLAGKREQLRAQLDIAQDALVFCFVGRLNRDKGIRELVQAFCQLPAGAHLLLVGERDGTAPVDAETLSTIGAHSAIHEVGFLDDVRPALAASDVLVLPSYREGFPNAVLQAGAMALPVIATDISGCNEVIEPGWNGWLVPPKSVPALADAMREAALAQPGARERMGRHARTRVVERFGQAEHFERMVAFYRSVRGQS